MNPAPYHYVAIDVSKDTLEVLHDDKSFTAANKPDGLAKLFEKIASLASPLVAFEATGGYERLLLEEARRRGMPFALLNPARVRSFARSEGAKAKTDAIDASVILRFAKEKKVLPSAPLDPKRQLLADLLDRRSHLTEHMAREKNRLQNSSQAIHPSIGRIMQAVKQELALIEKQIRELVAGDDKIREQARVAQSVVGVGEVTAWTLIAYLSEIESVSRNEIVALAGIAPFNDDSGKTRKKRRIQEGRAKVRKCLFMATRTAATHNPVIKEYVDALRARGKAYKCAIVAGMRKMLIHLQSLIKKQNMDLAS